MLTAYIKSKYFENQLVTLYDAPDICSAVCGSSADAAYAWRKMDGISKDGRKWKVDYATKVCILGLHSVESHAMTAVL